MKQLQSERELRERFIRGELSAAQMALSQRRSELTIARDRATRDIALASEQLTRLRKLAEVGLVAPIEVKRGEIRVMEAELELKRIHTELAALGSGRE
jgi:hypothetical protein